MWNCVIIVMNVTNTHTHTLNEKISFFLQKKVAFIEIAEYVLPKFEVNIDVADHFTLKDEKIQVIVRAKYTHGQSLRGQAIVSVIEDVNHFCYSNKKKSEKSDALAKKTVDVDGRGTIEFNIKDELKYGDDDSVKYYDEKKFIINVEMTESLTGLSQSTKKTITVHKYPHHITTDLSYSGIIRGSKFNATISVRNHDGSTINVTDANKKITLVKESFYSDVDKSTTTEEIYDLDENGHLLLTLETAKNESSLSLKVQLLH